MGKGKKIKMQALIAPCPEQIFRGFTFDDIEKAAKKDGWDTMFASKVLLCCARTLVDLENCKTELSEELDIIGGFKRMLKGRKK